MGRVAIFIDGGYLDKVLRDEFDGIKIDYAIFSREVASLIDPSIDILRTYYYHCLPHQSNPPTQVESARFAAMQRFFDSLNRLARFEVKLGRLARRGPDKQNQYYFEQKMVDVLLSIDLVALSTKGRITDVVIVAGDSDFVPAIETAKKESVCIWLLHGAHPHNELWNLVDERIKLTQNFLDKVRRP